MLMQEEHSFNRNGIRIPNCARTAGELLHRNASCDRIQTTSTLPLGEAYPEQSKVCDAAVDLVRKTVVAIDLASRGQDLIFREAPRRVPHELLFVGVEVIQISLPISRDSHYWA